MKFFLAQSLVGQGLVSLVFGNRLGSVGLFGALMLMAYLSVDCAKRSWVATVVAYCWSLSTFVCATRPARLSLVRAEFRFESSDLVRFRLVPAQGGAHTGCVVPAAVVVLVSQLLVSPITKATFVMQNKEGAFR